MFRHVAITFVLGCLLCVNAWARDERTQRGPDPGRDAPTDRRERARDQREEFRAMREQLRDQYRQDTQRLAPRREAREEDDRWQRGPALRRLEPEDRERLRRAMREAAREHYGR